jgi:FkbM family methyltransferase
MILHPLNRLKRAALETLPPGWIPPLAAGAAMVLDEIELHLLSALCRHPGVSVDVGANLGIYTQVLLRQQQQRVIAVEPNPGLARRLRSAFGDRIQVVEAALSSEPGRARIHVPIFQGREIDTRGTLEPQLLGSMPTHRVEVDVRTLDALGVGDVDFLKIDVEGHELDVMRGGMKMLKATHPRLLIELEERNRSHLIEQMVKLLGPLGYRGCFIAGLQVLDIAEYDPALHERRALAKGSAAARLRGYINNFIFVAEWEREIVVDELQRQLARFGAWLRFRHGMRS